MMKRMKLLWLSLTLVIGFSGLNSAQSAQAAKPIKLKFIHIMSAVSYAHFTYKYYADKIYERTKGRVKITVYPSGVLVPPSKHFEAIVSGISELGSHTPAYTPGPFPASEACYLPLPAANAWSFSRMASDFWAHFQLKELEQVHFLFAGATGPYMITTCDKPVLKPEDLQGLKMRAIGPAVDLVKLWGGTPVAIPMADVSEALSKRVIDGGILPLEAIASFKLGEYLKYATIAPVGVSIPGFIAMRLKKWNELPMDIQDVFTKTSEEMKDWFANAFQYGDLNGVKFFNSLPGRKFLELPAAEAERFIELAKPLTEKYITQKTAMGLPASDYVKYLWERGEYWNKKYPGDEKVKAWIEKELKKP